MFNTNVGTVDRVVRIIVGLAALYYAYTLHAGAGMWVVGIIGVILLATGLMSSCPLYSIFGIRTCKLAK